ncbi:hypothetical protein DSL72_004616 [Monilinia vaccinii-corymbosi]|uniref:Uncharacterized protein n=1 Tax=Monilinia vaccinii-corymbosi TaxID=61207 RepID=A0A8A3P489_9HELO|nr:hypothetical protein DSL72_004616 [Monilinia vaccinii-corymbosi]
MGIADSIQALFAAFSFGILLQAAAGALLVYSNGHGSNILKDSRRLVLVLFLLFSVLWAQIDFLELLIPTTSTQTCQTGLIFTTGLDQLARVTLEQFLLWSIGHGTKITNIRAILQGLLGFRLIVGGVLAGVTRPQFAPTCVADTSIFPVAIVVLAMDFIIVGALLVQASSLGMFGDRREDRKAQSRAQLLAIAGFTVWTITSVPMILGIPSIILIARTAVPASGLLVLVGIVAIFPVDLLSTKKEDHVTAGAQSPFSTSPLAPSRGMFQNRTEAKESPKVARSGTKNQLFVVNLSSTPIQRESRGFKKLAEAGDSRIAGDASGYEAPGGILSSTFAASTFASNQEALIQAADRSFKTSKSTPVLETRPKVSIRGLTISRPIVNDETDPNAPFAKIATIDLETAIMNDQERRAMASKKAPFNAPRGITQRPRASPLDMMNENNIFAGRGAQDQSSEWMVASGLSTSASILPARDEVRRRSPRGINNLETLEEKQTFRPVAGNTSNPRSQRSTMTQQNASSQPQTVMLMNDIVYDNPEMIESIVSKTPGYSEQKSLYELSPLAPYTSGFQPRESLIDRARPIPRTKNIGMFGNEPLPSRRRTKSSSSLSNVKSFFTNPDSPSEHPPVPRLPPIYTASNMKKLLLNDTKSMTVNEKIELFFLAPTDVTLINNRRSSVPDLPSMAGILPTSVELDGQSTPISRRTTAIAPLTPHEHPAGQNLTDADDSNRETYRSNAIESMSETLLPSHIPTATNILKLGSDRLSSGSQNANLQALTPLERSYMSQISSSNSSNTYRNSSYSTFAPPRSEIFAPDVESLEGMSDIAVEDDDDDDDDDQGVGDEVMVVMMDADEVRRSRAESAADRESFTFDSNGLPVQATHSVLPPPWHRRMGDELPAFSDRRMRLGSRKTTPPTALSLAPPLEIASPILIRNVERSPPLDSPAKALQEIELYRIEMLRRPSSGSIFRRVSDTEEVGGFEFESYLERLRLLENLEKEMGEQENDWQNMQQTFSRESMSTIRSIETPQLQASPGSTSPVMETAPSHRLSLGLRRSSPLLGRQSIRDNQAGISAGDEIMPPQIRESSSLGGWQQRLANAQMSYMEHAPVASHSLNSSINFLSVSKAPHESMESPTLTESETEAQPKSEYESEDEEIIDKEQSILSPHYPELLWQPVVQSPNVAASLLWSSGNGKPSVEPSSSPEPPAKNLRPAQRRSEIEMTLTSRDLWSKPSLNLQSGVSLVQALWGSTSVRAPTVKTRPVTQRPPRRSRCISNLADIVENPEPLPNKRDTLGIFQFPWGERSDTPIPQSTYNPTFQARPVFNGELNSTSPPLQPDISGYSSSSFFDYDEEDEEEELDYEMYSESDDEFDETTLWEIASLLRTTGIPSINSLLPQVRSSNEIIDDYDDYKTISETDFASENEYYEELNNDSYDENNNVIRNSSIMFSQEDYLNPDDEVDSDTTDSLATFDEGSDEGSIQGTIEALDDALRNLATDSLLWSSIMSLPVKRLEYGLPQPTSDIWQSYILASQDTIRTRHIVSLLTPKITSCNLWSEKESDSLEKLEQVLDVDIEPESLSTTARIMTWTPPEVFVGVPASGLFSLEARRQDFRLTSKMPAAIDLKKIRRVDSSELPILSSRKLWSLEELTPPMCRNWMLVNTAKPISSSGANSYSLMWTPSSAIAETAVQGLFQPTYSRANYRTTELEPAALTLTSRVRSITGNVSILVSDKLWRRSRLSNLKRDHDWISESSIRPSSPSIASEIGSGRSSPDISDASSIASTSTKASSLFSLDPILMRTTLSAKKKGEFIPPTPPPVDPSRYLSKLPLRRVSLTPTPMASPSASFRKSNVLSSRDLFEARIPLGSEKPQLPRFRRSVVPMKPVKPAHRAIRHQYILTVAFRANWEDALNEAIIAGLQGSLEVSGELKPSSVKSVVLETPHVEDSQIMRELLEPSFVDTTANDDHSVGPTYSAVYNPALLHPVFFTETLVSDVDNIHPAAMGHTKLLRLTASVEDWERALGKAISKSTPRMQRPTAFSFMWKDALKAAIASGIPKEEVEASNVTDIELDATANIGSRFDVASLHPVFFTTSMMSDTSDVHPAALGHVRNPKYNPAILHPVFFATTLDSTAVDIHPACIGHAVVSSPGKMPKSHLWVSKSNSMTSVRPGGMWTETFTSESQAHFQVEELASTSRRVFIQETMELPTLESGELWKPSSISPVSRNWLQTSSCSSTNRNFLFQKPLATAPSNIDALMWEPASKSIISTSDMFADIKHEYLRRPSSTHSTLLPRLESTELYKMSRKTKSEINWLRLSVAPIIATPRETMMWAASVPTTSLPDLFADVKADRVKRTSDVRPSDLPRITSTELFKAKIDQKPEVNWLRVSVAELANQEIKTDNLNETSIEEPIAEEVVIEEVPSVGEPTFEELMADIETLTEEQIAELLAEEVVIEVPFVGEPTFEELMADIETLTEEQITELLDGDEFS